MDQAGPRRRQGRGPRLDSNGGKDQGVAVRVVQLARDQLLGVPLARLAPRTGARWWA